MAATGYWAASDLAQYAVQPILGSALIGPSTLPINLTQFQEIIGEVSAVFDMSAAKAGYITPIPSSAGGGYVAAKQIVRNGVMADVFKIIYTGPDQKFVDRFEACFQSAVKAIEVGDRPLPGVPVDPNANNRLFPDWSGIASPVLTPTMGFPQDLGIPNDF